jgi:hypothetical protein
MPVPFKLVFCGLVASLSVTLSKPEREPVVVGVKVTKILQLAPAVRVLPHVVLWTA